MKRHIPLDPAERQAACIAERNSKMARSAHAYVRGSTDRFYEWLDTSARTHVPHGPSTWICGDCHLGNLGPVASAHGDLAIQIRDFDQTVIGNPAHDLVRLGLSLAMAARGSSLPGVNTVHILDRMIEGYCQALEPGDESHGREVTMPKLVRNALQAAAGRSWKHLADERIEGVETRIPLGTRFWPLSQTERDAVEALFAQQRTADLVTSLRSRDAGDRVSLIDATYWRKGCSSLGRLRLAVLVAVGQGKSVRHCLMDIKQATEAAAPCAEGADMPADAALRVVEGARYLSPALGSRMLPAQVLGVPVFVRELLPQDLKLEIEHVSRDESMGIAAFLAGVVGHAHARQLDDDDRAAWLTEFKHRRSDETGTPSWLWDSVVELVGAHEIAYLRHCRKHAADLG